MIDLVIQLILMLISLYITMEMTRNLPLGLFIMGLVGIGYWLGIDDD